MALKTGNITHNHINEEKRHRQAIESLSAAMGLPEGSVSELYQKELNIMSRTARIKDFLSILVSRKVRRTL